jgi:hypothetical protein
LKKKEEYWHPQISLNIVNHASISEGALSPGFKYSHFKHLVEKKITRISGGMNFNKNVPASDDLQTMSCSCKFKRVLVSLADTQEEKTRENIKQAFSAASRKTDKVILLFDSLT